MKASEALPRLWIRLPVDAKKWIAAQARKNANSQGSEIVRCIRERMDRENEKTATGKSLQARPVAVAERAA